MRKNFFFRCLGCMILLTGVLPIFAGDSLYGKVIEVKSANVVVFDYGTGQYVVRIIGIDVPKLGLIAARSKEVVIKMVLGKGARIRFQGRNKEGEMVSRLMADDPVNGVKDVGLELIRKGLARRQPGEDHDFGYKYGELTRAETEAKERKRGLWSSGQPR